MRLPPHGIKAKLKTYVSRDPAERTKPNLAYMHALIDSVEAGRRFGTRYPSEVELAAALRSTGRVLTMRQPGEDREEDAL